MLSFEPAAALRARRGGLWAEPLKPASRPTGSLPAQCSEFMADNAQGIIVDEDGTKSDWIEISNGGTQPAPLDGWFLTDNATFSVSAAGSFPISYQWFFNGAPIPGAPSTTCRQLPRQAPSGTIYPEPGLVGPSGAPFWPWFRIETCSFQMTELSSCHAG